MKKFISFVLAIFMLLSLTACGKHEKSVEQEQEPLEETLPSEKPSSSEISSSVDTLEQNEPDVAPEEETIESLMFTLENMPVMCKGGYFLVRSESGYLYGVVDSEGNYIFPCEYQEISFCETTDQSVLKILSKGYYGIFDFDGNEIVPCQYLNIDVNSTVAETYFIVNSGSNYGVLDAKGNEVVPCQYSNIDIVATEDKTVFKVKSGSGYGVLDSKGNEIVPCQYYYISVKETASQTVLEVCDGQDGFFQGNTYYSFPSKYGVIDLDGNELIPCKYSEISFSPYFDTCIVSDSDYVGLWELNNGLRLPLWFTAMAYVEYENGYILAAYDETLESYNEACELIDSFEAERDIEGMISMLEGTYKYFQVSLRNTSDDFIGIHPDGSIHNYSKSSVQADIQDHILAHIDTANHDSSIITFDPPMEDQDENSFMTFVKYPSMLLRLEYRNGCIFIYDRHGNILLSEDGFADVQEISTESIYSIKDWNGNLGLVNVYAEIIVPLGNVDDPNNAVTELPDYSNLAFELEATYESSNGFIFVTNDADNSWTLCRKDTGIQLTDFISYDSEDEWDIIQYNCLMGYEGYSIISEDKDMLYLVSRTDGVYSVYSYVNPNV